MLETKQSYIEFEKMITQTLEQQYRQEIDPVIKEMMRQEVLRQRMSARDIWVAMGHEVPDNIRFETPKEMLTIALYEEALFNIANMRPYSGSDRVMKNLAREVMDIVRRS